MAREAKSDWARDNKQPSGNMVNADFDHAVLLTEIPLAIILASSVKGGDVRIPHSFDEAIINN